MTDLFLNPPLTMNDALALLAVQAREIERLNNGLAADDAEFGMREHLTPNQMQKRIRELEAERDNFRGDAERAIGQAAKFAQQTNTMKNERDAVRAKTIEECTAVLQRKIDRGDCEPRIVKVLQSMQAKIRALAQTDESNVKCSPDSIAAATP